MGAFQLQQADFELRASLIVPRWINGGDDAVAGNQQGQGIGGTDTPHGTRRPQ